MIADFRMRPPATPYHCEQGMKIFHHEETKIMKQELGTVRAIS